jgi:hypothetical protein
MRPFALQKQAWDVVLREKDRERNAVLRTVFYIAENPARGGVASTGKDWPYSGAQAAGYPELDWRMADFHERVWTIFETETTRGARSGEIRRG